MCQLLPIASCPSSVYHWEEPGSFSITAPTLPSQVLVHMDKNPSESSLLWLSQPFSCNLFLYVRFSSPLNIFVTPQWTCSRMYKTLLSWGAQHWTQHSQFVASVLSRMKESCIHPLKLCLKRRKALLGAQWRWHQSFELPGGLSNFCLYAHLSLCCIASCVAFRANKGSRISKNALSLYVVYSWSRLALMKTVCDWNWMPRDSLHQRGF